MRGWRKPVYQIWATFRAPLPFVFDWCTDISPIDPELRRRHFVRKIIGRSRRRVVYEDLEESDAGWTWDRNVVTREPPDRWRLEAVGNHYDTRAEYRLTSLAGGATRLELRFQLRPKTAEDLLPAKGETEREVRIMWRRYAAALERDYRRARTPRAHPPRSRRRCNA